MPTVPSATQTTATSGTGSNLGNAGLGKDDFLKLLVGQLSNQDPMNPTSDADFIGQMAQFSQLEQTTNTATAIGDLVAEQSGARAVSLLGRTVTYPDGSGSVATGEVEKVQWSAGVPSLTVGGVAGIDPKSVTAVQ
jgi:flagellar basal-body rod modification protein FlgD